MILRSCICPGPQWRELPVGYVIAGSTGERIVPGPNDRFWIRVAGC